jgi:DNA topoisomerase-2
MTSTTFATSHLQLLQRTGLFLLYAALLPCLAGCRYIYTRLAGLTRHLFNKADDKLLTYLNEEGQSIEPEW